MQANAAENSPIEDMSEGEVAKSYKITETVVDDAPVNDLHFKAKELPVKEYLDSTVVPVLRDGLRILAKER